jgi:hypothetical protein
MNDRNIKQVLSGDGCQWDRGRQKKKVKRG